VEASNSEHMTTSGLDDNTDQARDGCQPLPSHAQRIAHCIKINNAEATSSVGRVTLDQAAGAGCAVRAGTVQMKDPRILSMA
jgi:hypothetical protein